MVRRYRIGRVIGVVHHKRPIFFTVIDYLPGKLYRVLITHDEYRPHHVAARLPNIWIYHEDELEEFEEEFFEIFQEEMSN